MLREGINKLDKARYMGNLRCASMITELVRSIRKPKKKNNVPNEWTV
jgi:hypothetical protein